MKTMKQLCLNARQVQSASNLSGVVHSFSRDLQDLKDLMRSQGTEPSTRAIQEHPMCVLYASKIASLTSCEFGTTFHEAWEESEKLIKAEPDLTYHYIHATGETRTLHAPNDADALRQLAPVIDRGEVSTFHTMEDGIRRTLYNYT